MLRKLLFVFFIPFFFPILLSACSEESVEKELTPDEPYLEVKENTVNFGESEDSKEIIIKTNDTWTAEVSQEGSNWCQLKQRSGSLIIKVSGNEDKNVRQTTINVTTPTLKVTIKVAQLGWGKAILLSSSKATVPAIGGETTVKVTTNVDYMVHLEEGIDWIRQKVATRAIDHPVVTKTLTLIVNNNKEGQRQTTITIKDKDEKSDLTPVNFTVDQAGLTGEYQPINPDDIKNDIKVKITGGIASSEQNTGSIAKSYDGDFTTMWHSKWDNNSEDYFPITTEYTFESGTNMDYMIYYPRRDGMNGLYKLVDIEVKTNANTRGVDEWQLVMTYDFKGSSSATLVEFPAPLIGVSAIRLTIRSGAGERQGFASCAEIEFYKKNPEHFNYSELFTDVTCSELKNGITEQEILKCNYAFFKNIAYYMFHGKYNKEFRVNTFKAYPHPDEQVKTHKTTAYSMMDNPTGIAVEAGEDMVVLATGIPQETSVSIRIQNLDKPDGDGFTGVGGENYPLINGINKFKIEGKGLIYVMYHTPNYAQVPNVKLHFASGRINGYYDSQNPDHKGRAQELLNKATDKFFDVLGKYAHLTFPTNRFKNHTKDLHALINIYDEIVYNEQELLGLVKYNKMFKNRMYFNVMYHSYMYSASYHTGYHDDTLKELCNEDLLTTTAIWGPAHEVGHSNQTRPGVKWRGTTEGTNNIMSEYIQTTVFGQPSRIQSEKMKSEESPNRYSKAWNSIVVRNRSHAEEEDVFCKLIPFWQLELYFGKVLGRTPREQADKGGFYPDIYEYVRTHPDLPTPGEQQLEFVYITSKVAGMNLLDFFEKWGFLSPVDIELDDYGKERVVITQSQIDAVKQRVNVEFSQKPTVALEYITDINYQAFKQKASVQPGTATRSGNKITMNNWKNVVVYEVRDGSADGKLICVSDGILTLSATASFSIVGGWKPTYKVYAVSYDNKRIEVTFS